MAPTVSKPTRGLFDLPLELRQIIYNFAFSPDFVVEQSADDHPDDGVIVIKQDWAALPKLKFHALGRIAGQLLATCSQVYLEASPFFYARRFFFGSIATYAHLVQHYGTIGRYVKHVELEAKEDELVRYLGCLENRYIQSLVLRLASSTRAPQNVLPAGTTAAARPERLRKVTLEPPVQIAGTMWLISPWGRTSYVHHQSPRGRQIISRLEQPYEPVEIELPKKVLKRYERQRRIQRLKEAPKRWFKKVFGKKGSSKAEEA